MTDEYDRCAAAHDEDPTPCEGPQDAVLIRDRQMSRARDAMTEGVAGCVHHGARMLASIEGSRVYPGPGAEEGAAIEAYNRAQDTRPFAWLTNAPRTRPDQLSRAENRQDEWDTLPGVTGTYPSTSVDAADLPDDRD